MITSGSAADREPPNPSGLARITLVAQILLLSPMQSSLHLHMSRCSEHFTNGKAMNHKRRVMNMADRAPTRYVRAFAIKALPAGAAAAAAHGGKGVLR